MLAALVAVAVWAAPAAAEPASALDPLEDFADTEERAQQALTARWNEVYHDPEAPVAGNPDGDVTLVEFFDYRCGYCKQVHPAVKALVAEDGRIRFVSKEFPILGPPSSFAARAALASRSFGGYHAFSDALMSMRGKLTARRVMEIAGSLGIDPARLGREMDDPAIETAIARNHDLARALAIQGTPTFIVGRYIIRGAVDAATLREIIAEVRAGRN